MIDWLIPHPPARACEGVRGRGMRRSLQCGIVFVAVSYTYLGGDLQPPEVRKLRFWIYSMCGAQGPCLCHPSGAHTSPTWRCAKGLFRRESALFNVGIRAMSVCSPCFANMHACLHAGGASIRLRMNFALCCGDVVG